MIAYYYRILFNYEPYIYPFRYNVAIIYVLVVYLFPLFALKRGVLDTTLCDKVCQ